MPAEGVYTAGDFAGNRNFSSVGRCISPIIADGQTVGKHEGAVNQIAEHIGQVLVCALGEAPNSEVCVGRLRRVDYQSPAPVISREFFKRSVTEHTSLLAC